MIVNYNGYAHDNNECWFSIDFHVNWSEVGERMSVTNRWTITGVKKAATKSALTTSLIALEAAYSNDFGNLNFYDDDGITATAHGLQNASTIGGVRVKDFRYLPGNPGVWGSGTEYVQRRTFQVVIEGDVLDYGSNVIRWHESVRLIGNGGAKFIMMGALTGPVQRQDVQQFTPYVMIQQGYAFGLTGYPFAPNPIAPLAFHNEQQVNELRTPKFGRVLNTEFGISWRYVMESATALVGGPTLF